MKILIIVSSLTDGGAERVAASWANGLKKIGNDVYVISDYSKPVTYKLQDGIVKIQIPIASKNKISRLLIDPIRKITFFRRTIKSIKPDVILSVLFIAPITLRVSLIGIKNNLLNILTDHNSYERPLSSPMSFKHRLNKFYLTRLFDHITVLTKRDKEILIGKGIKNVTVMYNPLFLNPLTKIPKKENIILAVGRMDAWHYKGFDLLIKAWNKLYKDYPSWKLRIVGNATQNTLQYLKSLCDPGCSLDLVKYTDNIQEEYKKASVFILSSRYEGWGLVLVEAMSQGCAAIACDNNGRQTEIISNNKNGIIIAPENIEAMITSLRILLDDSAFRDRLQKEAPKSVGQFSEINIAKKWMELLQNLKS